MITSETLRTIIALQNRVLQSAFDLSSVMETVVEELAHLIPHSCGAVVELCDGDALFYRAASGAFEPFIGLRLPREGSMSGLCATRKQPVITGDAFSEPAANREAVERVGVRSMICYPLIAHGECVGVCKIAASERDAFAEADVEVLGMVAGFVAAALSHADAFDLARRSSRIDSLTGLGNRRAYDEAIGERIAAARRTGATLSVVLFDLNGFKAVNDTFGHAAGDAALETFAQVLQANVRATDTVYRLGGDEFCIILPDTAPAAARSLIERLKAALDALEVGGATIGFSCGVADLGHLDDAASITHRADMKMFEDKRGAAAGSHAIEKRVEGC